jgi:hypothetical protein
MKHWIAGAFPGSALSRYLVRGNLPPPLLFGYVTGSNRRTPSRVVYPSQGASTYLIDLLLHADFIIKLYAQVRPNVQRLNGFQTNWNCELLTRQLGKIRLAGKLHDFRLFIVKSQTSWVTPAVNPVGALRQLLSYVRELVDPTTGVHLFVVGKDIMSNPVVFKNMLNVISIAIELKRPRT